MINASSDCREITLQEMAERLKILRRVVLCCHVSPDGDTVGSATALAQALRRLGMEVVLAVDDVVPHNLLFLPCADEFKSFAEDETICADALVVIDASSYDRIGNVALAVEAPLLLNIDHHRTNTRFADYLYVDDKAAATAEIIYELLPHLGVMPDKEIATSLFTGIYTDTGSFKYSNTTQKTFQIAGALLAAGVDPGYVSDRVEAKSRKTVTALSRVLQTITFIADGRVSYVEIAPELYDKEVDSDTFISYPRYTEGVEIAALFKQVNENVTRCSLRSKNVDVSKIAFSLGGGGHAKASGLTIDGDLTKAKSVVLPLLCRALKNL